MPPEFHFLSHIYKVPRRPFLQISKFLLPLLCPPPYILAPAQPRFQILIRDQDPALLMHIQEAERLSLENPSRFFHFSRLDVSLSFSQIPSGPQLLMHIHDCGSPGLKRCEDILAPTFSLAAARFHRTQRPGAKIPSEPCPLMHIHH